MSGGGVVEEWGGVELVDRRVVCFVIIVVRVTNGYIIRSIKNKIVRFSFGVVGGV